ncbi:EAL and GGDEF domain-containing protein [Domibacillus enclensis]|uniref:Diguanylate cyclase (GGDEF) domain-containing protein n=2 Tax=Domibacillus enclensis TaxID=1017273 RepID=A0A1N7BTJ8_9BACI|nr:bifunctional diguanylate cyclase/phosphodiesterase [Domibacillus enclensis]SIR54632.1 diguanylate cyclase (GGDEF) domain-containing protein [Domibacillus enclensis]
MRTDWLSKFTIVESMDLLESQIAVIDQDGVIVAVNRAWTSFTASNDGDMVTSGLGVNYLTVLEEAGEDLVSRQIRDILQGKASQSAYSYPCHSPEEERWFCMKAVPVKKDDVLYGALIIHENITETELYKQETTEVLESMTDAFLSINEQLFITYINSGAAQLIQRKKENVIGRHVLDVFPEAVETEFFSHYENVFKTKKAARFEAYYPALSTWFESSVYPQKNGGLTVYFKDIRDRKKAESQLRRAAYFDELTNLPNRRFFIKHLHHMIEAKQQKGEGCAVLFMDLDGFKNINDTLGHDTGDVLLQEIAVRLRDKAGPDHFVSRLGGDEFLIIFSGASNDEEVLAFTDLLLSIVKEPILIDQNAPLYITASVGISLYPVDGDTPDELMRKADMAMYQSKKLKGNQAVLFHDELHQHLERRLYIEENLKNAAENDEIFFMYQPQVNARTGKIIGFEVLSRWKSAKFGWISPVEFIHIAEESGHIADLTRKMMKESFAFFQKLRTDCGFSGFLSINLSSKLLTDPGFAEEVRTLYEQMNWPKETLEIEITESVPLFSSEHVFDNLEDFRKQGICVAVDDFGTGYSALSYLHDFPLDKIKVDKQFVDQIDKSSRGEALLSSILHLANSLDLLVIAEGVETKRQLDWLVSRDCFRIQGYYYYRPLGEKEVTALFEKTETF